MKQTILIALFTAAAAAGTTAGAPAKPSSDAPPVKATAKPAAPEPDICTGAVDPYSQTTQRTLFFQAAGPDNEMSEKEFSTGWSKAKPAGKGSAKPAGGFARRFDRWKSMLAFDKNGNRTIDWFEAASTRTRMSRLYASAKALLAGKAVVEEITVSRDKVVRAEPLEPVFEAGHVHLRRAHWNGEYLRVMGGFPGGKHDDDADATSGGFHMVLDAQGADVWVA